MFIIINTDRNKGIIRRVYDIIQPFNIYLKKVRQSLELSVAKMSKQLEMSASTLTSYERGERTPSVEFLTRLYKVFNINTNWFVSGEGTMFNKTPICNTLTKSEFRNEVIEILKEEGIIKKTL